MDVLPPKQASMLTEAAKNLSKDELTHIMTCAGDDHHDLNQDDINSLTALAAHRINNGQNMFGFTSMRISADNSDGGPNRNW